MKKIGLLLGAAALCVSSSSFAGFAQGALPPFCASPASLVTLYTESSSITATFDFSVTNPPGHGQDIIATVTGQYGPFKCGMLADETGPATGLTIVFGSLSHDWIDFSNVNIPPSNEIDIAYVSQNSGQKTPDQVCASNAGASGYWLKYKDGTCTSIVGSN